MNSNTAKPYDAIIVGARCAGAPCAMLLARQGLRVLLLDRDHFPSNMPQSTHLMHPLAIAKLKAWGLLEPIAARTTPLTNWRVDLYGQVLAGPPPPFDGNTLSYAPRRHLLDDVLVRAAIKAGAELREACTVTDLVVEADRVVGVEARERNGRKFVERAKIVIGADGPGSVVAHRIKAQETNTVPIGQSNLWSYFEGTPLDEVQLYVHPKAGAFAFPSSDGSAVVATNLMYGEFIAAKADRMSAFRARLRQVAPSLADMIAHAKQVDRLYAGCTRAFVRKAWGPGWALIGDAGMKKDPVTAQGIPSAFLTAEWMADAVAHGLSGPQSLDRALADYEAKRDAFMMPFYDFTARLAEFNPPNPEQDQLYRALKTSPTNRSALFGAVALTHSPTAFFAPDNIRRIIGAERD